MFSSPSSGFSSSVLLFLVLMVRLEPERENNKHILSELQEFLFGRTFFSTLGLGFASNQRCDAIKNVRKNSKETVRSYHQSCPCRHPRPESPLLHKQQACVSSAAGFGWFQHQARPSPALQIHSRYPLSSLSICCCRLSLRNSLLFSTRSLSLANSLREHLSLSFCSFANER